MEAVDAEFEFVDRLTSLEVEALRPVPQLWPPITPWRARRNLIALMEAAGGPSREDQEYLDTHPVIPGLGDSARS